MEETKILLSNVKECATGNMVIRKFQFILAETKIKLFNTYSSPMYKHDGDGVMI